MLTNFEKIMAKKLNDDCENELVFTPEEVRKAWKRLVKKLEIIEKFSPKHLN